MSEDYYKRLCDDRTSALAKKDEEIKLLREQVEQLNRRMPAPEQADAGLCALPKECNFPLCSCKDESILVDGCQAGETQTQAEPMNGIHPSHSTRSSDSSAYDVKCIHCGATDETPGGFGKLAYPCPAQAEPVETRKAIVEIPADNGAACLYYMDAKTKEFRPCLSADLVQAEPVAFYKQWRDAFAAFTGAFDTPQMRRTIDNEYAADARKRLREFNERMASPAMHDYSDERLRTLWRLNGGDFHGPNVETATMPEAMLLEYLRSLYTQPRRSAEQAPIDMLLFCPKCGKQHVDAPELFPGNQTGDAEAEEIAHREWMADSPWTNPPHKSHLCHACGNIWRPADVPTNGVAAINTKGKADTWDGQHQRAAVPEIHFDVIRDWASEEIDVLFQGLSQHSVASVIHSAIKRADKYRAELAAAPERE